MVEDRITDGRRIAQLLASELDGRADGELSRVAVVDADRDVEPTEEGTRAYDVSVGLEDADQRLARVFVHPEYARLEFDRGWSAAFEASRDADERTDLRVDRDDSSTDEGGAATVFVESGAAVKRATAVLRAVCRSATDVEGE